jgi:hypothetical protein
MQRLIVILVLLSAIFTNYNIYLLSQICTEIQYRITAIGEIPSQDNVNRLDEEEN